MGAESVENSIMRRARTLLVTMLATAAISALAGTTNAQASVAAAPVGSLTSVAYVNRIVVLVNAQRAAHGLRPLVVSPCATHFASPWTTHMAATNTLVHQSLAPMLRCPARTAGENIAYGNVTADQMMSMWMNSPGHRANILNPAFTRIGVGAVRTTSGRWWATQDFVTPLTGA
ncbi:MAG: hypothetical protein QOI82_2522 [Actinomycetota bacterium]|nr:hypothetical protein [Actinomycetota bacterium]